MPHRSRWQVPIPKVSLPTYCFGSATGAMEGGDKPSLIDTESPDTLFLTRNDYRLWSKRLAVGLQKAGFKKGETLMIYSGNTLFFPVIMMGSIMAGGKFTGANPSYTAREVAHQLKNSEAKYLLCLDESLDVALEAAQVTSFPKDRILICDDGYATLAGKGQGVKGHKHWTSLLASVEEGDKFRWEELGTPEQLNRTVALNYSSGTTGLSKGVEITHMNYVANTHQTFFLSELHPDWPQRQQNGRWLCFLPMYHALAQSSFCVGAPSRQIPVYIMRKFDFLKFLENVQKFRITLLTLVPPIAVAMAKSPLTKKFDLSSVLETSCGAAPLGSEQQKDYENIWPDGQMNMKQGYGMTEVTCALMLWDPREHSASFSVGETVPNCEVKLMNDEGTAEVAQGERGEIWGRGPNIMKGYWKNAKATQETLTEDGWLKTGDIAYMDTHGKYFIVDRKKELIKVKGLQVAPAELEGLLLEHPAITDAAVIGVTINGEEVPRAYAVKAEGKNCSEEEIKKWMAARVSKHKRLDGGVCFTDAIIKNPSGKIMRRMYREQAEKELKDSAPRARL